MSQKDISKMQCIHPILVQMPTIKNYPPVAFKHFHRIQPKNGEEFHLYHQLVLANHQTGIIGIYCPVCHRFLDHTNDKIEPLTQSEENGGWT